MSKYRFLFPISIVFALSLTVQASQQASSQGLLRGSPIGQLQLAMRSGCARGTAGGVLASAPPIFGPPAPPAPVAPAQTPPAVTMPQVNYPLSAISAVTFSPDGKRLALGAYGQAVVYDTSTWKQVAVCSHVIDATRSLTFTPDGNRLAIGCGLPSRTGQMLLWSFNAPGDPVAYSGQNDAIESVAFSKDGKQMMLGSDDNTVRFYADASSKQYVKLDEHNGRVQAVAFSPKGGWIFITGAMDRLVKIWDPHTMHTVVNFDQSENGITGLAFLSNGVQFVGSSLDGRLYWWGVNYNEKKQTFSGYQYRTETAHPGGVYSMSMSADNSRLITCGADSTVGIWNSGGGRIRVFKDADQPIYSVALSPDGKTAVGGGRAGVLYIWDVENSKLLNIIAPPPLPGVAKPVASTQAVHKKGTR